jgi:hypothetical protein
MCYSNAIFLFPTRGEVFLIRNILVPHNLWGCSWHTPNLFLLIKGRRDVFPTRGDVFLERNIIFFRVDEMCSSDAILLFSSRQDLFYGSNIFCSRLEDMCSPKQRFCSLPKKRCVPRKHIFLFPEVDDILFLIQNIFILWIDEIFYF